MIETWIILVIHQTLFQGMFVLKNLILKQKIGIQIRGTNKEASIATSFIAMFIVVALIFSFLREPIGTIELPYNQFLSILGSSLLFLSLIVAGASLVGLRDSWRIGIIEEQKTTLITSGIYKYSRNPYFVSYLLLFGGYTVILQNFVLLLIMGLNTVLIHKMIIKEEQYLKSIHGNQFLEYTAKVRRYL